MRLGSQLENLKALPLTKGIKIQKKPHHTYVMREFQTGQRVTCLLWRFGERLARDTFGASWKTGRVAGVVVQELGDNVYKVHYDDDAEPYDCSAAHLELEAGGGGGGDDDDDAGDGEQQQDEEEEEEEAEDEEDADDEQMRDPPKTVRKVSGSGRHKIDVKWTLLKDGIPIDLRTAPRDKTSLLLPPTELAALTEMGLFVELAPGKLAAFKEQVVQINENAPDSVKDFSLGEFMVCLHAAFHAHAPSSPSGTAAARGPAPRLCCVVLTVSRPCARARVSTGRSATGSTCSRRSWTGESTSCTATPCASATSCRRPTSPSGSACRSTASCSGASSSR